MYDSLSPMFGFGYDPADDPDANFRTLETDQDATKGVTPEFLITKEPDLQRSKAEGRPCYRERETVILRVAGDPFNRVSHPVDDRIRQRFPAQYQRWKANRTASMTIEGTPLDQWPVIGPAMVAELAHLDIFNVEGLASVADGHITRSPSLRELRAKAQAWLNNAKTNAEAVRLAGELQKRDEKLEEQAALIKEMADRLAALEHRGKKAAA